MAKVGVKLELRVDHVASAFRLEHQLCRRERSAAAFDTRFRLIHASTEKIQQFLQKYESAADDVIQGFGALDLQDSDAQRKPKYMEQLVGRVEPRASTR